MIETPAEPSFSVPTGRSAMRRTPHSRWLIGTSHCAAYGRAGVADPATKNPPGTTRYSAGQEQRGDRVKKRSAHSLNNSSLSALDKLPPSATRGLAPSTFSRTANNCGDTSDLGPVE